MGEISDGKALFHEPVSVPVARTRERLKRILRHMASHRTGGSLGGVVFGPAQDRWLCVDPLWSTRVVDGIEDQAPAPSAGNAHRGARGRQRRPKDVLSAQVVGDASDGGDEDGRAHSLPPPPAPTTAPPRRSRRVPKEFNPDDIMAEALDVCVRQACRVPSSSRLVSDKPSVSATLVTHDQSQSRAIVLRFGAGKRDMSILWVSPRGGYLCSCFGGTQNALILAASARSTRCKHAEMLEASLVNTGIDADLFRSNMILSNNAADYAVGRAFGTSFLWIVLYRSVYSLVTFTAANVATCIAPGCRRFRGRCGHVRVGRLHRIKFLDGGGTEDVVRPTAAAATKATVSAEQRAPVLTAEDEDDGVEKQPSDTIRSDRDAEESAVAARMQRNLLPCAAEIDEGEVWNRTADWHGMLQRRGGQVQGQPTGDDKMFETLLEETRRRGLSRDTGRPLVEPFCGSCGAKRGADVRPTEEPAILHTHHPTAPPIKVCCRLTLWGSLLAGASLACRARVDRDGALSEHALLSSLSLVSFCLYFVPFSAGARWSLEMRSGEMQQDG